jgi:hypothetical protein
LSDLCNTTLKGSTDWGPRRCIHTCSSVRKPHRLECTILRIDGSNLCPRGSGLALCPRGSGLALIASLQAGSVASLLAPRVWGAEMLQTDSSDSCGRVRRPRYIRVGAWQISLGSEKFWRFCRKVQFWGQNPKIGCQAFNDLQTPKLSKKQLCARTSRATIIVTRRAPALSKCSIEVQDAQGNTANSIRSKDRKRESKRSDK